MTRPQALELSSDDALGQERDTLKEIEIDVATSHGAARLEHIVLVARVAPGVEQQTLQSLRLSDPSPVRRSALNRLD